MRSMVHGAIPGDVFFFYCEYAYTLLEVSKLTRHHKVSGHGSREPDKVGGDTDGLSGCKQSSPWAGAVLLTFVKASGRRISTY